MHGTDEREGSTPPGRAALRSGGDEQGAAGSHEPRDPAAPVVLERVEQPPDLGAYLDRTAELVFLAGDYTGQAWLELDRPPPTG